MRSFGVSLSNSTRRSVISSLFEVASISSKTCASCSYLTSVYQSQWTRDKLPPSSFKRCPKSEKDGNDNQNENLRVIGSVGDRDRAQGPIRFRCAGWSYKEWIGPLCDPDKSMLQQYSSIFEAVEIDSSFYRFPERGTILGMTRYTPRGFVFSAKMNKKFTHDLRM